MAQWRRAVCAVAYPVAHLLAERNLWPLIAVHATWNTVAI
jgi:hypothetical protein